MLILPLLNFQDTSTPPDIFYTCYIMKRRKDQEAGYIGKDVITIKQYCFQSETDIQDRYEEIKTLCEIFKARCYIQIQQGSFKHVAFDMMITLASRIRDGHFNQHHLFQSTAAKSKVGEKKWLIDIDTLDVAFHENMKKELYKMEPVGEKVIIVIPTKNGVHFITKPFRLDTFAKMYPDINVKKSGVLTLLYFPNSLLKNVQSETTESPRAIDSSAEPMIFSRRENEESVN